MRVDHITIHVPRGTLANDNVAAFMEILGFEEIEANEDPGPALRVRWFSWGDEEQLYYPYIHLVEGMPPQHSQMNGMHDQVVLGHLCIAVDKARKAVIHHRITRNGWMERDSGSGRFWARFMNIRVEVRHDGAVDPEG